MTSVLADLTHFFFNHIGITSKCTFIDPDILSFISINNNNNYFDKLVRNIYVLLILVGFQ